ncbi:MAG: hypothetical protein L0219_21485, partial [Phycisphaerales bacterium]|nr:hypothetical protein [Phycisphaerales bacterium]
MREPVNYVWRNGMVRLCCKGRIKDLNAEPQQYMTKLDEAIAAQQRAKYPLKACVVGGQNLGSMGEPVETIIANRLVRLPADTLLALRELADKSDGSVYVFLSLARLQAIKA